MKKNIFLLLIIHTVLFSAITETSVGIYEFWRESAEDNVLVPSEKIPKKWEKKGIVFHAFSGDTADGLLPVYCYYDKQGKDHIYSIETLDYEYCEELELTDGIAFESGVAFYAFEEEVPGSTPVYLFYHSKKKNHRYSTDPNKKSGKNWNPKGVQFYVFHGETSIDCNGTSRGKAVRDDCGICSEGKTGHDFNSDKDCLGDCFGTAIVDDCGVCSGSTSGHVANSDKDCAAVCNGDAFLDDCKV